MSPPVRAIRIPPPTQAAATNFLDGFRQLQRPRRKIRVLCLHGFRTNAQVMIGQTKGLRAAMDEDDAEFIFINAPFVAIGPSDPVVEQLYAKHAPFYEWWYGHTPEGVSAATTKWHWSADTFDETIAFLDRTLREIGPIDVVIGFSQGCMLLTAYSMLKLQRREEAPWKLCVCVSAVALAGIQFRHLFETPDGRPIRVHIPSIHVVGKADPTYHESVQHAEEYDALTTIVPASPFKKLVLSHEEGHRFPSPRSHRALYEQVARQIYDHCRACEGESGGRLSQHALARL